MSKITFVIAGNYKQFKYYYPKPDKHIIYLNNLRQLMGQHDYRVDRVGTWYERPDIEKLEIEIRSNQLDSGEGEK